MAAPLIVGGKVNPSTLGNGTPDSTTFLRGDKTWAVPPGGEGGGGPHATTHQPGGDDAMAVNAAAGTGSLRTLSTTATSACAGNDARLSDARTPLTHSHAQADVTSLVTDLAGKASTDHSATHEPGGSDPMAANAAAGTASLRSLGTTSTTACAGNDARLSDARTPIAHRSSHITGGGDAFLSSDVLEAIVKRLQTTTGPTTMLLGAVADGEYLRRSGTALIGATPASSGATWTDFTKDLGVAKMSGTFDITGLSGLTAGKNVSIIQTAQAIASKGNARDEMELDPIVATGYVVDATTVRGFWNAPGVVVGTYAFAFQIGA